MKRLYNRTQWRGSLSQRQMSPLGLEILWVVVQMLMDTFFVAIGDEVTY